MFFGSVENQYLVGASSPTGHSISSPQSLDLQPANDLDAPHERVHGQSVMITALPRLPPRDLVPLASAENRRPKSLRFGECDRILGVVRARRCPQSQLWTQVGRSGGVTARGLRR